MKYFRKIPYIIPLRIPYSMEQYMKVLKSYKRMPIALEQILRENIYPVEIHKHQVIQEPAAICDYIYFVEKDLLRYYYSPGDTYEVVRFKKENDFIFCLKSVFSNKNLCVGIEALEDCVLWALAGSFVPVLLKKHVEFYRHYDAIMMIDMIQMERSSLYCRTSSDSAKYDMLRQEAPDLFNRVPISYLARYTEIPEKVFRHLQRSKIKLNMQTTKRDKR